MNLRKLHGNTVMRLMFSMAIAIGLFTSSSLQAMLIAGQAVNMDFLDGPENGTNATSNTYSGQGALPTFGNTWNGLYTGNPLATTLYTSGLLNDSQGVSTSVSISVADHYGTDRISEDAGLSGTIDTSDAFADLLDDGIWINSASATVTISGLDSGLEHNLAIYSFRPDIYYPVIDGLGANSKAIDSRNTDAAELVMGANSNYVSFLNVLPDASGEISFTWTGISEAGSVGGQFSRISGLQVEAVPEPSTLLMLLGIAGAGVLLATRRKCRG